MSIWFVRFSALGHCWTVHIIGCAMMARSTRLIDNGFYITTLNCYLDLYSLLLMLHRHVAVLLIHPCTIALIISLVAIYFFETSNICPVRVSNCEIWYRHRLANIENGSINIIICFHFNFKASDDYIILHNLSTPLTYEISYLGCGNCFIDFMYSKHFLR